MGSGGRKFAANNLRHRNIDALVMQPIHHAPGRSINGRSFVIAAAHVQRGGNGAKVSELCIGSRDRP
jgi:hypothetical protein